MRYFNWSISRQKHCTICCRWRSWAEPMIYFKWRVSCEKHCIYFCSLVRTNIVSCITMFVACWVCWFRCLGLCLLTLPWCWHSMLAFLWLLFMCLRVMCVCILGGFQFLELLYFSQFPVLLGSHVFFGHANDPGFVLWKIGTVSFGFHYLGFGSAPPSCFACFALLCISFVCFSRSTGFR